MRAIAAVLLLIVFVSPSVRAETAVELETQAMSSLKLSQNEPDAIISASILIGLAADGYATAGDSAKVAEMNSFLYWCKKKISIGQMDTLARGGETAQPAIIRMKAFEKAAPWPAEAAAYYRRAEVFSQEHTEDHFLIGVRFFEVADRFKGQDLATQAQERSLKEFSYADVAPAAAPKVSAKKVALPTPAQQKAAEKVIRDLFKDDFAKTTTLDKQALARKLIAQAADTKDDIPGHFALQTLAANLAAEAGDLPQIAAIFASLTANFEGDMLAQQKTVWSLAATSTKDPIVAKTTQAYRTLLEKPADSAALVTVGKFECFVQNDFARGLARLAASSHPTLSKLAKDEIAKPDQPAAQLALADAWWDNGEKSSDKDEKRVSRERSVVWYEKALPGLTGLSKTKVEARLAAVAPKAPAPAPGTEPLTISSGAPIGKPTDLLNLIDPARDKSLGVWQMRNKALECKSVTPYGYIKVRYRPGEQYDLRSVFTRLSGDDIGFFIFCGGRRTHLSLCGWHNKLAGFHGINGHDVDSEQNPTRTPNSIVNGKEYKVDIQVRKYSVRILLNDTELIKYAFEGSEFTGVNGQPSSSSEPTFGLWSSSSVARFTALQITELPPASPDAKPPVATPPK